MAVLITFVKFSHCNFLIVYPWNGIDSRYEVGKWRKIKESYFYCLIKAEKTVLKFRNQEGIKKL